MDFIKKNKVVIVLVLFLLWASASPDAAATAARKVLGWVFGKFLPGLGDFLVNLVG
ncbi:MAG TPA: hypothetical protein VFT16_04605 [Candidatus Saccharimonadales bacterium]|nr:hypothetical protein [Candidatus Saccharimonadales bacterium]